MPTDSFHASESLLLQLEVDESALVFFLPLLALESLLRLLGLLGLFLPFLGEEGRGMSSIGVVTGVAPTTHFPRETARASGVKLSRYNVTPSSPTNESYSSMIEVSCPKGVAAGL